MTFGMLSRVLLAAVAAQKCPSGKGLCDCISSFDGVVLESATYKLLDLPADCATEWITRPSSKTAAEVEAENPGKKLVTGGNTAAGDANQVCRVKFSIDSAVEYHNPETGNYDAEPEYHHTAGGDTHTDNWYLGRVYGTDGNCHFGTWSVTAESSGEEFFAPSYDLLFIPSTCTPSWKDGPGQVSGRVLTQDEKAAGAAAFCERSAVCAVKDSNGVWHPGYAVGAHRTQACTDFCQDGDCDGVCAGCDGCLNDGAPMGEGAAEGGCGMPDLVAQGDWTAGETVDSSQVDTSESSALVASVCLMAGLLAA